MLIKFDCHDSEKSQPNPDNTRLALSPSGRPLKKAIQNDDRGEIEQADASSEKVFVNTESMQG